MDTTHTLSDKYILLFDGVCNMCNGVVNFIIDHDTQERFVFASLQSEIGQTLLINAGLPLNFIESVVLIKDKHHYTESDAVLHILKQLPMPWSLLYVFKFLPSAIRNILYRTIARNRYKLFGKRQACRIPTPAQKARFL